MKNKKGNGIPHTFNSASDRSMSTSRHISFDIVITRYFLWNAIIDLKKFEWLYSLTHRSLISKISHLFRLPLILLRLNIRPLKQRSWKKMPRKIDMGTKNGNRERKDDLPNYNSRDVTCRYGNVDVGTWAWFYLNTQPRTDVPDITPPTCWCDNVSALKLWYSIQQTHNLLDTRHMITKV